MKLERTGEKISFFDLKIGEIFCLYDTYWTRTAFEAGYDVGGGYGYCCFSATDPDHGFKEVQFNPTGLPFAVVEKVRLVP